jgi:hypothetical protein
LGAGVGLGLAPSGPETPRVARVRVRVGGRGRLRVSTVGPR